MNPIAELVGLVRIEFARRIRGWKRAVLAGAVGGVFLGAASFFALLAIFLYLARALGAPDAALIMAAGLAVPGIVALVIASIRPAKRDLQADVRSAAAGQLEQIKQFAPGRPAGSTVLKIMAIAFAVGLLTGRRKG